MIFLLDYGAVPTVWYFSFYCQIFRHLPKTWDVSSQLVINIWPFNAQWVVGMIWQKTVNNSNHSIIMLSISWER